MATIPSDEAKAMMVQSRRGFLMAGAASTLLPLAPVAAASSADPIAFAIWRQGREIGTHRVAFEGEGAWLVSRVEIDVAVKLAFITTFRYRQRAVDHWRDGILVRSEVQTDDDGKKSDLLIEAAQDNLIVDGPSGELEVPIGLMTDACFWNPDIVRLPQLISASKGSLAQIAVAHVGRERVFVLDREVDADHYNVSSSEGSSGDIWYDDEGRWVQSRIRTHGEEVDYRLIG